MLVVDDEPEIRSFLSAVLADEGYAVVEATNGREALTFLEQQSPDARPAVILLDLFMPVMDGATFLKHYKQRPPPHVPVIALSASARVLGISEKMPDVAAHLDKPFSLDALLDQIRIVTE